MSNVILISGVPRSGTSLTAGIINLCGAWGGEMSGPNSFNQKGMFENSQIRDKLTKPYLKSIGCDPMGQNPLPHIDHEMKLKFIREGKEWRAKVINILKSQGLNGGTWFYKGAKMCLFWPLWDSAFPTAKWVIVRRKQEDIIRSCMKTPFMRAYDTTSGWMKWILHHEKRFIEIKRQCANVFEVWPDRAVKSDYSGMMEMIEYCGLSWDVKKVGEFISPELWGQ